MTRSLESLAILLSVLLVGVSFMLQNTWSGILSCIILAVAWLALSLRRVPRAGSPCFMVLTVLAALSLLNGAAPLLPYLGFWIGLAAWDLSDFSIRTRQTVPPASVVRLEKIHLIRLAYTLAAGLALGLAGLFIHFQLSFITASILVILAFLALAFAVRGLVKKNTRPF